MFQRRSTLSWLVAPLSGLLLPGYRQLRSRRYGTASFVFSVIGMSIAVIVSVALQGLTAVTEPSTGRVTIVVGTALSCALAVSVFSSWRLQRPFAPSLPVRALSSLIATISLIAASLPAAAAVWFALPQIRMTEHMFVTAPSYTPQQLPTTGKGGQDTVPAEPIAVLLLGGDAGTGRWGLRPDSINVAIFDPDSGRAGIIGIPRNLWGVPMPGKLADRFPDGFPGMINALHTWALGHRADVESALGATDHPGEALIAAVVSELTGIRLDGWVLVDMRGFIDVVDAVGPVDIWVERHVPLPGNIKDAKHPTPGHLDRGWHRLDGTDLLAYARSRSADSDYGRMRRQRCILASIAAQHTGPSLLLDWPSIARAAGSGVRTSLSSEQTLQIARYARAGVNAVETLSLSPPLMRSYGWDRSEVRAHVAELMTRISPTAGAPDAAPSPTSSVAPRAGEPQTDLPTTSIPRAVPPTSRIEPDPADLATLPPATTTPEVQAVVVTDEGCRTSR